MLDLPLVKASRLAVVRRFSGGGTVVVDRDTLMVSFIFGAEAAPHVPCFPAPLMLWSEQFYSGVFHDTAGFRLRENGESDNSCLPPLNMQVDTTHVVFNPQITCLASANSAAMHSASQR
jgi:hypothetical protein